jgi:hypothetical protein
VTGSSHDSDPIPTSYVNCSYLNPLFDPGEFGHAIDRRVILEAGVLVMRIDDIIVGIRTLVETPVDA